MGAISEFQLLEEIYGAGSTRVYRAIHPDDGRSVILKILSGDNLKASDFAQYRREYEVTDALKGVDGVIAVHGLENIHDSVMIVEEDIGGRSLAQIFATERIGLVEALELSIRIADILGRIHQEHVIHKDFNPANIVWNRGDGALRVIDFGIASQLSHERHEFQSVNQLEGSLAYISPEQTGRVNRKLDYRSDLYSLGISLYQLFTGTLPFVAREGIELVHAHIALPPAPPHEVDPEIPPALSRIVMHLVAKMAEDRYQSAFGLKHDLQRCLDQLREMGRIEPFALAENDVPIGFQIPQRLYGREQEIATILSAFDRVAGGGCEVVLVSGVAGTGKSALVHEIHKPLTDRRGSFIAGKFDQYQRDVPFYPWILAFEELCNLILKEDESSLAQWRDSIAAAVGNLGKVVTDVFPAIESIIGAQAEVPALAGEQALNRLSYVFGNFLKAVCREEHPLVVFVDDWQWADAGSLSLLKSVLASKDLRYLLLIGAYRDNEVHGAHPFAMAIEEAKKSGAEMANIALSGLGLDDVHGLVRDALADSPGVAGISGLIYEKTQGNAFFVVQLLNDLYEKGLVSYSPERRHWVWRQERIESSSRLADNVVDLMAEKIRKLPDAVQRALIHAACIGDRFALSTLALILGEPAHQAADELEPALLEGILIPIGLNYRVARQKNNTSEVYYQFVHDRVRQAAYGMLDEGAGEKIHYDIANCWLAEFAGEAREQHIFDIANQFNAGRRLVVDDRKRGESVEINFLAGKRARNSTAYSTALHYFKTALESLAADSWLTTPERVAELHLLAAETAFLSKDYGAMERLVDAFLGRVQAPLERVKAYKIRLQAYVAQNRLSEAVDVALHALGLLGIELPKSPGKLQVMAGLMRTKLVLRGKSLDDLRALPAMTAPAKLAAMELLGLTIPPAYWTSQGLVALTVFQMVRESVAHGYSPNAGYGFSWWGITECAMLGNIDSGCEFGEFAIELARKRDLNLQQPLFFAAWIIRKFKYPLRDTLAVFEQAYALSLEKGDFEYASYARNNYIQTLFHTGRNLALLLPEMERAQRDLQRFQIGSSLYWHGIWWQVGLNFVQASPRPHYLGGPAYDEAVSLPQHLKVNDVSTLFLLHCAKLMLSCFFGDKENALVDAAKARTYLPGGVGMHAYVLFHVYESLALLANHGGAGNTMGRVTANQKMLRQWADHAPMNYRHHWLLVEAERLRVTGKSDRALRLYDQALDLARDNGFVHEEALIHELAARCHIERQEERLAGYYLKQALQLYERWGASAKSTQLEGEFSKLLLTTSHGGDSPRRTADRTTLRTGTTQSGHGFDIAAVTAASQAISSEIVIDNLITTLLKIVIEHSGAQKALLILKNDEEFSIQARGTVGQRIEVKVENTPIDDRDALPLPRSMIQYVARTLKSQVIYDARQDTPFSRDPYIRREMPLSVLCEPIVQQGKLVGMIYLENNLMVGAFTEERLELLRLLSSQAAISIQNALLYRFLERKVEERTQKLQDSLLVQERLNGELQASSQELAAAHDQLREANGLLQQLADTDGLTGLANRRYFNERMRYELDRCVRERQPLALIMCDLDNFKRFNDAYGHVAGDDCLRRAARAFQSVFGRATDLVARYGGEEFVVLLPMTQSEQAASLGEAMREAVAALNIPHGENGRHGIVTISAGCYALVPDRDTTLEKVVGQADMALYQAKNQGRNCLVNVE